MPCLLIRTNKQPVPSTESQSFLPTNHCLYNRHAKSTGIIRDLLYLQILKWICSAGIQTKTCSKWHVCASLLIGIGDYECAFGIVKWAPCSPVQMSSLGWSLCAEKVPAEIRERLGMEVWGTLRVRTSKWTEDVFICCIESNCAVLWVSFNVGWLKVRSKAPWWQGYTDHSKNELIKINNLVQSVIQTQHTRGVFGLMSGPKKWDHGSCVHPTSETHRIRPKYQGGLQDLVTFVVGQDSGDLPVSRSELDLARFTPQLRKEASGNLTEDSRGQRKQ